MKKLQKLTLILLLTGLSSFPVAAGTFGILTGGLTVNGIVDPTFNFLGLDFRGTVGLNTPSGAVLLTDTFANPAFGNTTLVATNPVFDGTGVAVDFQLPSFSLLSGGSIFNIQSLGTPLVGPLSAPESETLPTLLFSFLLTDAQPIPSSPNTLVTYSLSSVSTVDTATPEPAALSLGAIGVGMFAFTARRRRTTSLKG